MAREMPYWVFHQEQLNAQLEAYVAESVAKGVTLSAARFEADVIRAFLEKSPAAKPLKGGRAG